MRLLTKKEAMKPYFREIKYILSQQNTFELHFKMNERSHVKWLSLLVDL
jgi:hypothetical protein